VQLDVLSDVVTNHVLVVSGCELLMLLQLRLLAVVVLICHRTRSRAVMCGARQTAMPPLSWWCGLLRRQMTFNSLTFNRRQRHVTGSCDSVASSVKQPSWLAECSRSDRPLTITPSVADVRSLMY